MKNPNGYGCVKKLSGHRRRPYIFVVSEDGKQRVIGAFPSHVEALIFQTELSRGEYMRRHILDLRILSLLPIRIPPSALLQLTLIRCGASSVFGQKSSIKTVFLSVYPVMRPALDLLQFMCFRSAIREKSLNT